MPKLKTKRLLPWQAHAFLYVALWGVWVAAMGWVSRGLIALLPMSLFTTQQFELISILLPTLLMGIIPVVVTERFLRHSMRNWLVYTLLGTLFSLLWFGLLPWQFHTPLFNLVSLLCVPTFQMVWLWRRVNNAWLWPATHLVTMLVFRLILPQGVAFSSPMPLILMTLVLQCTYASLMYYLWTQAKDTEKAKMERAKTAQSDEARVKRLQESEMPVPPWEYDGDQQVRYNEA